ncbi:hypothetical protein NOGI109294_25180 [Nocardiopsis gilva]
MLRESRQGESDLVLRDGTFYLVATCDVPDPNVYEPDGFIGVDLGIANIATTSTGYLAAGRKLNRYRRRQQRLRAKLQAKGTKSAKRLLKKRARREQRHAKDTNHVISKRIVTEAERTSAGIALEGLTGIRQRVRLRKPQRVALHSWAFARLGQFITYKARRAGVPLVFVDPAYTSQTCAECGHVDKRNRVDQGTFICRGCRVVAHADRNASHNISHRGEAVWNAGRKSHVPPANPLGSQAKRGELLTASGDVHLQARSFRAEKLTLPPAEIAVHPTESLESHEFYFMCDDVEATMRELTAKGVDFTQPITDAGWGRLTRFRLPGGGEIGMYEPRHERAIDL